MRLILFLVSALVWGTVLVRPTTVLALQSKLSSEFEGKNLTSGSDWGLPIPARVGDVIRYRLTISNADGTDTANAVTAFVMLPYLEYKHVLAPVSYVLASNTRAKDAQATTDLVDENNYGLEYIPGTSKLTKDGSTKVISPDTAQNNLTISAIDVGNIAAGSGNVAVVEFEAKVVEKQKVVKPASATPTPKASTGGGVAATGSAVAKTSPQTGFIDPVIMNTLKWAGVGVAGLGMRVWANKVRRKADEKWSKQIV